MWERFANDSEAEMPPDDKELVDVLSTALLLARDEWGKAIEVTVKRLELGDDLPAFDLTVRHRTGFASDVRVFLCNRPTQGGGLKRQLDKVLTSMQGKSCFMLRASDFPPNKKNQTAQAFRKFRDGGGRQLLVPIPEWERMMTVREFTAHHRGDAGMNQWLEGTKPLSSLISIVHLLRLDLLGRPVPRLVAKDMDDPQSSLAGMDDSGGSAMIARSDGARNINGDRPTTTTCRCRLFSTRTAPTARAFCQAARSATADAPSPEQERVEASRGVPRRLGFG